MKKLVIAVSLGLLALTVPALALTPDGQPPSVETVCDSQSGAAFGLCNAYCEAMDCDSANPQASATACQRVRDNYTRITGQPLPCDVTCPCGGQFALFAQITSGGVQVSQCIQNGTTSTSVSTSSGDFVIVNSAATPPYCTANNEPPLTITALEATVCQFLLRQASSSQGVTCTSPE
jgi:hypothetical protein